MPLYFIVLFEANEDCLRFSHGVGEFIYLLISGYR